jgi:hypothetical protein
LLPGRRATGCEITNAPIAPIPGNPPNGRVLGLAVKKGFGALARALQDAMDELTRAGQLEDIFVRHGVPWRRP